MPASNASDATLLIQSSYLPVPMSVGLQAGLGVDYELDYSNWIINWIEFLGSSGLDPKNWIINWIENGNNELDYKWITSNELDYRITSRI